MFLAAQSIGEPSTQMTLNTFHLAGHGAVDVTQGIPRMREVLLVATKSIKTPVMNLLLRPHATREDAQALAGLLRRISFMDVLTKMEVGERVDQSKTAFGTRRERVFTLYMNVLGEEDRKALGLTVARVRLGVCRFIAMIASGLSRELNAVDDMDDLASGFIDDEVHGSSNAAAEEADSAKDASNARQTQEGQMYGADDNGEPARTERHSAAAVDADGELLEGNEKVLINKAKRSYLDQISLPDDNDDFCWASFRVPLSDQSVLMTSMAEELANKVNVKAITGVTRASVGEPKTVDGQTRQVVACNGVNLATARQHDELVDVDHLYCNCVMTTLEQYGVEAARAAIINEVSSIFKVYGIGVDARHLSLIADHMTREGGYKPFNRHGIDNSPSQLHKMTYETTTAFLTQSALYGISDNAAGPSSRVAVGRPLRAGTGMVDILLDMQDQELGWSVKE
ncbi:RNA polymerase Rpb1 domain 5 [Carpediemonas membranifera]|uniref:DNA-directed RNA polymerase n=1 Tax=Carpediemonas membranifera TaxID=201153 RepID=A0A8J6E397_9EUKA|nr:RNA polymerase Rpb1 domain 5 [Carpediemonas membranifera]|eukprot:KAG9395336.1 RNA polymerase Rpb1 domain 5 [Carpediemonas membranifera]